MYLLLLPIKICQSKCQADKKEKVESFFLVKNLQENNLVGLICLIFNPLQLHERM